MNCKTKLKTIFYITKCPTFFVICKIKNVEYKKRGGLEEIKDIKEIKEFNEADRKH